MVSDAWIKAESGAFFVFLSVLVQLPLAVFLGHYYDEKVFITTGYLVSAGLDPYQTHELLGVFHNPFLSGVNTAIGYPPPWPLLLGLIYRATFNLTPSIFLYNFAIKIPIIASNIGLAYVVRNLLQKSNISPKFSWFAWLFLLFNPFILLTTTAWGQIDGIVALLCVVALAFLAKGNIKKCAIMLGLSIALKPIALPLIGLPFLFSINKIRRKNLQYGVVFLAALFTFSVIPFFAMNWSIPLEANETTAHFRMAGGLTLFNIIELFTGMRTLPENFEVLGYIWIPALLFGYYVIYRNPPKSMDELAEKAVGLLLIFFLTRSWLSEPNINLLLPLMLIVVGSGRVSYHSFHLAWIIPLMFMFLNMAVPQLFFLAYPSSIPAIAAFDSRYETARFVARYIVTILWFGFAVKIAKSTNKA